MKPAKFLLIDNSEIDNFVNVTLMKSSGLVEDIVSVQSVKDGLKYLHEAAEKEKNIPEYILLDLGMQIMDGFGFMEEFVKLPPSVSQFTRILVLTSSIDPKDRMRSMAYSSVIDLMEKPLNLDKLKELLSQNSISGSNGG